MDHEELKLHFQNVTAIYGALRLENSQIKSFSIFQEKKPIKMFCDFRRYTKNSVDGVKIVNNSQLTDLESLKNFELIQDYVECSFEVQNNKMLDAKELCGHGLMQNMVIRGNLRDCGRFQRINLQN